LPALSYLSSIMCRGSGFSSPRSTRLTILQHWHDTPDRPSRPRDRVIGDALFFSGHRRDEFDRQKWLMVFRLAQLRPRIVGWSTLCRADWVRNDSVRTIQPGDGFGCGLT
jgi:hypothetical protein